MISINSWNEVMEAVSLFRKKGLRVANFYPNEEEVSSWIGEKRFYTLDIDANSSCFIHESNDIFFIFLYLRNIEIIVKSLEMLKKKYPDKVLLLDWICRSDDERELMKKYLALSDFSIHTSLRRMSLLLKDNKFENEATVIYAQEYDVDEIYGLFHSSFNPISERIPTKTMFKKYINSDSILVMKIQNKIAGVAVIDIQKKTMYLKHIVTNPNFRGQGIATSLLNKAFFLSKNCIRYILWVIENNYSAIGLYKKFGYEFETLTNYTIVSK